MRLIQFFKWWWNQNDWFNRTLGVVAAQAIFFLLLCIFIGKIGILFALGGALSIGVMWIIYGIFYWLRGMWQEFEREVPTEDIEIINRLKGVSATMHRDDIYDDD